VFLDIKRLQKGEAFDSAFAKALVNSSVIVPLMSANALQGMTKQDGTWCDNVLLEWIIAAECIKAKGNGTLVKACYPIFIGNISEGIKDTDTVIGDFFASGMLNKLPACVPTETIKMAKKLLLENNVTPSSALDTYTVASFINEFKSLLGYKVDCKARKLPSRIANDAHEVTSRHLVEPLEEEEPVTAPTPAPALAHAADGTPLGKLYALITNSKMYKDDNFAKCSVYLAEEICVSCPEDLGAYIDVEEIMNEIKAFLHHGGQVMFAKAAAACTAQE
jgi:hypothetical protein